MSTTVPDLIHEPSDFGDAYPSSRKVYVGDGRVRVPDARGVLVGRRAASPALRHERATSYRGSRGLAAGPPPVDCRARGYN